MIKNKNNLLLAGIILLGLILRFWKLDKYPVSLNWDEVSHGYNAYSILKTGKDEWGATLPAIFRAFGDYKLPVYIYLTIIPVFLFGLNAFAVRFISALAGVIAIPLIYLLANKLFLSEAKPREARALWGQFNVGHLAAFLLAITPWHFFISRPALEANLALTLILAGAYFFLRGLDNPKFYLPSAICYALSIHTYNTARVFVPLMLIASFFIYRKKIQHGPSILIALLIMAASLALVLLQVLSGSGTARYQNWQSSPKLQFFRSGREGPKVSCRNHWPVSSITARFILSPPWRPTILVTSRPLSSTKVMAPKPSSPFPTRTFSPIQSWYSPFSALSLP